MLNVKLFFSRLISVNILLLYQKKSNLTSENHKKCNVFLKNKQHVQLTVEVVFVISQLALVKHVIMDTGIKIVVKVNVM